MNDAALKDLVAQFWKVGPDEVHDGLLFNAASLKGMSSTRFLVFLTAVETHFGARLNDPASVTSYAVLRRAVQGGDSTAAVPASPALPTPTTAPRSTIEAFGLGHDLEEVRNLPEATDFATAGFYTKNFTAGEIAYCTKMQDPRQHFAARICAKEALYKCSDLFRDLKHAEVEVVNDESGRPQLRILNDAVARRFQARRLLVSLSHTDTFASATVLLTP